MWRFDEVWISDEWRLAGSQREPASLQLGVLWCSMQLEVCVLQCVSLKISTCIRQARFVSATCVGDCEVSQRGFHDALGGGNSTASLNQFDGLVSYVGFSLRFLVGNMKSDFVN